MKKDKNQNDFNQNKHDHFNKKELMDKLIPLIDNTAMRFNLIPIEVDLSKENHRWFLRIFIYSTEKNIGIEDCENVSRSLGDFLDELIPFKFYLEVSSPGIERKLKSEREYIVFKGKDISLKLKNAIDDSFEKQFIAKILDYDENEGLKIFRYLDKKEFIVKKDNIIYAKLYDNTI